MDPMSGGVTGNGGRTILVLHGPNLNLLGRREPGVYGTTTLDEINLQLHSIAAPRGFELVILQSNYEGALLNAIHDHGWSASGIIINPGAFTHYSIALRDGLAAVPAPAIEIHLSNTAARESFRHHSVIAPVARGTIAGLGPSSYTLALQHLMDMVDAEEARGRE